MTAYSGKDPSAFKCKNLLYEKGDWRAALAINRLAEKLIDYRQLRTRVANSNRKKKP